MLKVENTNKWTELVYESLYREYHYLSDEDLITKWKKYQLNYIKDKKDTFNNKIAISVCEDLLRQRGNTYLDENYPRD